ncbi:MAG: hypothetical protein P4L98_08820 [Ancalomicrobiaceae bacterium]|nr:hypothetical protein [Ancalomicrobiaceae bacterium]
MSEFDPIPSLMVFVLRKKDERRYEFGTGTLLSDRLILTALHVVCDVGPGLTVPDDASREEILVRLDVVERFPEYRTLRDGLLQARLVWPLPGEPAVSGRRDIALLSIECDNQDVPRPQVGIRSHELAKRLIGRAGLTKEFQRLVVNTPPASLRDRMEWTFSGYPILGQEIWGQTLAELGKTAKQRPLPRAMTVPSLSADNADGYCTGYSGRLDTMLPPGRNTDGAEGNKLAGTSGAAGPTFAGDRGHPPGAPACRDAAGCADGAGRAGSAGRHCPVAGARSGLAGRTQNRQANGIATVEPRAKAGRLTTHRSPSWWMRGQFGNCRLVLRPGFG